MRRFISRHKIYIIVAAVLVLGVAVWMGSCGGGGMASVSLEALDNPGAPVSGDSDSDASPASPEDAQAEEAPADPDDVTILAADGEKLALELTTEGAEDEEGEDGNSSAASKTTGAAGRLNWFDTSDVSYWYWPVNADGWTRFLIYNGSGIGKFSLSNTNFKTATHGFSLTGYGTCENDNITSKAISIPANLPKSTRLSFSAKFDLEKNPDSGEVYDYVQVLVDAGDGRSWRTLRTFSGKNSGYPNWSNWSLALPSNAGTAPRDYKIRFKFVSDGSVQNWGFAVDELRVFWDKEGDITVPPSPPPNEMPVASFYLSAPRGEVLNSGPSGTQVYIDARDSYDPDNQSASNRGIAWYWLDVGADGTWEYQYRTNATPTGPIPLERTTFFRMMVEDSHGAQGISDPIMFNCIDDDYPFPAPPIPVFWLSDERGAVKNSGPPGTAVYLYAVDSYDPNNRKAVNHGIKQYIWEYQGDGAWDTTTTSPTIGPVTFDRSRYVTLKCVDIDGELAVGDTLWFRCTSDAGPGQVGSRPGRSALEENIDWAWAHDDLPTVEAGAFEKIGTISIPDLQIADFPIYYTWGMSHKQCVSLAIAAYYVEYASRWTGDRMTITPGAALRFLECSQIHNEDARAVIHNAGAEAVKYAVDTYGGTKNPKEWLKLWLEFAPGNFTAGIGNWTKRLNKIFGINIPWL